jgi:hypothetical protein
MSTHGGSNYLAALRAEMKRVVRHFQAYTKEQRIQIGYRESLGSGEYFYTHPEIPNIAFETRARAAEAALDGYRPPVSSQDGGAP